MRESARRHNRRNHMLVAATAAAASHPSKSVLNPGPLQVPLAGRPEVVDLDQQGAAERWHRT